MTRVVVHSPAMRESSIHGVVPGRRLAAPGMELAYPRPVEP